MDKLGRIKGNRLIKLNLSFNKVADSVLCLEAVWHKRWPRFQLALQFCAADWLMIWAEIRSTWLLVLSLTIHLFNRYCIRYDKTESNKGAMYWRTT
jgi:hypothetical protein